jgi:hypothetical protein
MRTQGRLEADDIRALLRDAARFAAAVGRPGRALALDPARLLVSTASTVVVLVGLDVAGALDGFALAGLPISAFVRGAALVTTAAVLLAAYAWATLPTRLLRRPDVSGSHVYDHDADGFRCETATGRLVVHWGDVVALRRDGARFFVYRASGEGFVVPDRFFDDVAARDAFERALREHGPASPPPAARVHRRGSPASS